MQKTGVVSAGSKRIKSIDVLRGMTVAAMILVNNPGSWSHMFAPLKHAPWNGLTPTDLIFPFFLFIMGVSMYISLSKSGFESSPKVYKKIFRRAIILILIGWAVSWFSFFLRNWFALGEDPTLTLGQRLGKSLWALPHLRILGVFPRLGLTYAIAACLTIWLKNSKRMGWVIGIVLFLYAVLLLLGNGFAYGEENILSRIDLAVLGRSHMYWDNGIEPEGLVSTIPAAMQVLLGVIIGSMVMTLKGDQRLVKLFVVGVSLTLAGYVLGWWIPVNKKVWSPSFALVTSGLATTFLALLMWVIDHKGEEGWTKFFKPFGMNPLFTYLASTILALLFIFVRIPTAEGYTTISGAVYGWLSSFTCPTCASFLYSFLFLLLNWGLGYILYKKKIYIKI